MTDIRKKNHIKVMNFSTSQVCVTGRLRGYLFPSCRDGMPSFEYMDFDDIEYINSKSPVFRNGDLQFEDDEREEIFEALKYHKWRDTYLDEDMIEDILCNPTLDNLKRVTGITSPCTIERVRSKLISAINNNADGVSTRSANVIRQRFRELQNGKARSVIQLEEPTPVKSATSTEVAELKAQNDRLQAQIDALMAAVSKANPVAYSPSAVMDELKTEADESKTEAAAVTTESSGEVEAKPKPKRKTQTKPKSAPETQ